MNDLRIFLASLLCIFSLGANAFGQSYKFVEPLSQDEMLLTDEGPVPKHVELASQRVTPAFLTTQIPLPVAFDPNDMLMQDAKNQSDFGAGYAVGGQDDPFAVFRLVPNINLNAIYDTGIAGTDHSPSDIAITGSPEARGSGKFSMNAARASLKTDVQLPSITTQIYMDLRVDSKEALGFRHFFGRTGNWLGGSYFSSFSDNGTLPQSIISDSAPAGAIVSPETAQLQYVKLYESGLLFGGAIENPNSNDFALVNSGDTRLQRYPDFVARARFQPLDSWGSIQGAILVRQFGYEDIGGVEHFSTGVSYSANARFKTFGDSNVRLGVVSGTGTGNRLFGINSANVAAGPVNNLVSPLQNTGAFGSYQHFWSDSLFSNVAYGYAFADVTPGMADSTRTGTNGWINLIWNNPTSKIGLGVEYQIGHRELGNGQSGTNHAIQLSLQIGKGYKTPDSSNSSNTSGSESKTYRSVLSGESRSTDGGTVYPRL